MSETHSEPPPPPVDEQAGPAVETENHESRPVLSLSSSTLTLLHSVVEGVAAHRRLYLTGMSIKPDLVSHPSHFLPALLVVAAESWTPVVVANERRGGFTVRLKSDESAMLGYSVVGIKTASPFLLAAPVSRILMGAERDEKGDLHLDRVAVRFGRWLRRNGLDASPVDEREVRVIDALIGVG